MKANRSWIFVVLSGLFLGIASTNGFARECNRHCLEQLLAQIATLREEVRNSIPIGTILPYSGSQGLPQGYVICDGAALDRVEYADLFGIIGLSYTPEGERLGATFRLPDLRGRAPIGSREGGAGGGVLTLGQLLGQETQALSVGNLPRHRHGGVTGDENANHTHNGRTGDDSPDHVHSHARQHGLIPLYNGIHLNHAGSHHNIAANSHAQFNTGGANTRHQHDFVTGPQNQRHRHPFTTDDGANHGLQGTRFSVMQPSIVLRYMIKAR